jgi:hypothetical protein
MWGPLEHHDLEHREGWNGQSINLPQRGAVWLARIRTTYRLERVMFSNGDMALFNDKDKSIRWIGGDA